MLKIIVIFYKVLTHFYQLLPKFYPILIRSEIGNHGIKRSVGRGGEDTGDISCLDSIPACCGNDSVCHAILGQGQKYSTQYHTKPNGEPSVVTWNYENIRRE